MVYKNIGIVVIGRNESARLEYCFKSLSACPPESIVYVDSNSSDNSIEIAQKYIQNFIKLDTSKSLSAARARNEGFYYLKNKFPNLQYVQFIDGDCTIEKGWLETSEEFLNKNKSVGIVCGLVKEKNPEKSIYNGLCQVEWDLPAGETSSCGGIFLCKAEAFIQVNGFDLDFNAGEEPELCFRLIKHNWKIYRLNSPMCVHDSNILSIFQFLNRIRRSGYSSGISLFTHRQEFYNLAPCLRTVFWGFFIPALAFVSMIVNIKLFLVLCLLILIQFFRIFLRLKKYSNKIKLAYSATMLFGKPTEFLGFMESVAYVFGGKKKSFNYIKKT